MPTTLSSLCILMLPSRHAPIGLRFWEALLFAHEVVLFFVLALGQRVV